MALGAKALQVRAHILFSLAALLVFTACSKNVPSKSEEDDIHEAVLRYQVQAWYSKRSTIEGKAAEQGRPPAIVKFSVNGKDASDEFLRRFRDLGNIYVPSSRSKTNDVQKSPNEEIIGITFSSERITWISNSHVEVTGGYYCGNLCASGETFDLRKENGTWKVKSSAMHWIS